MTYSTSNPPVLLAEGLNGGLSVWGYKSTDVDSATNASDYYSNGVLLGMKVGDIVLVSDTTTPKTSFHGVVSASGDAVTTGFGAVA